MVVIPGDVALSDLTAKISKAPALTMSRPNVVSTKARLLNWPQCSMAARVALLCGRGCEGAHEELIAFADKLKAPIVHALGGKEHVEFDNPFDVGMTGLIGFSSGYKAMLECDTLVMLGTDFPCRPFYPTDAKIDTG